MSSRWVWLVLPDQLSIRIFFDAGIVDGLRDRLDGASLAERIAAQLDVRV